MFCEQKAKSLIPNQVKAVHTTKNILAAVQEISKYHLFNALNDDMCKQINFIDLMTKKMYCIYSLKKGQKYE